MTDNSNDNDDDIENIKENFYKGLLNDKISRDLEHGRNRNFDMKPLWKTCPKPYAGRPDLDPDQTDPLAPFKQFLDSTPRNGNGNVHSPQASQSGSDALSPNGSNSGASGANALSPRGPALYRQSGNGNVHSPQASQSGSDALSPNGSTSGASGALSPLGSALSAMGSRLVPRVSALSPNRSNSGASGALSPMGFALSPRGSALSPRGSALSPRVSALSPMESALYRQLGNGNVYSSQASQSGSDVLSPNGSNSGASWANGANETCAPSLIRPNSGASGANGAIALSPNRSNSGASVGASWANGVNETSVVSLNRLNSGASVANGASALSPNRSNSGASGGASGFLSPNGSNSEASGANGTSETLTPKDIWRLSPNAIVKQHYDSIPKNGDGTPAKPKSGTGTPESQRGLSALSPPTGSESGVGGDNGANGTRGANGAGGALRLVVEAIRMEVDEEISMEVDDEIQISPNRGKPFSPNQHA